MEDNGTICGVSDPKTVIEQVQSWIAHWITPTPVADIQTIYCRSCSIIHVYITPGGASFYSYDGRPYIRVGSKSAVATLTQVEALVDGGKIATMIKANIAKLAALEDKLGPAQLVAAAVYGQGELATMDYNQLRDRLFADWVARREN